MTESKGPSDNSSLDLPKQPDNPPKKRSRWSFPVPTFSKIVAAAGAAALGAAVASVVRKKARSARSDPD